MTGDTHALVRTIVRDGLARYFAARHERVAHFVQAHFSLLGTLRLHRAALGWDIALAPLNLAMAPPQMALWLAGKGARRFGASRLASRMASLRLVRETAVARRIRWLVVTELLELPCREGPHEFTRDALAETILADPRVIATLQPMLVRLGEARENPALRARIERAVADYAGTRGATTEITMALISLGAGLGSFGKLTPGAVSLGPVLAGMLAQQAAVASFPFGSTLGSLWYAAFPVAPAASLVAGLTGGLVAGAALATAFAGIIADPLQRALGLHQRRLHRLLTTMERQVLDPDAPAFALYEHYLARLMDLFDLVGAAYRLIAR
jgi:hypothetical protein